MKILMPFLVALLTTAGVTAQINAKLMRYMDVSQDQIVFVYGGDIWLAPKGGGTATQVTHSPGEESWPRFSPDGSHIAYTASYRGNMDIYTLPVTGGVPHRITYHSFPDRMIDWHPDGEHILFASRRELGQRSSRQFFMVPKDGGFAEKMDIPYGELATFSPDGSELAYITKITENYPFKRYRGGLTSDILIYDFGSHEVKNVTNNTANDGKPAWAGNKVYFLSDQGPEYRLNIWSYDTESEATSQVTGFKDFDISFLSAGPEELVFEVGGSLYLMDLSTEDFKEISIHVISDLSAEMPRKENVAGRINNMTAAPKGKRIIFEARGELFNVPQKEGYTINLTGSSGAFDREPSWSPDGSHVAYWSDKSGENEIYLAPGSGEGEHKKVTNRNKGYGYTLHWSPDSKNIAFIDEKNDISILNVESQTLSVVDNADWNVGHGGRHGFTISWSPDSKWITYDKGLGNANNAIFVYNLENEEVSQVSSGYFQDSGPVFSADGKYLFYLTNRNFSANYSDMGDGTWIYPNSTQIAALGLTKDAPDLLSPRNDTLEIEKKDKEEKSGKEEKEEKKEDSDDPSEEEEDDSDKTKVVIDFDDIESRLRILPPDAGNIGGIIPFEGKFAYLRFPNTGSGDRSASLVLYDLKEREEKEIISNVRGGTATADGKELLVNVNGQYGIIQPAPNQKIEDPIPTGDLVMDLVPREEWRQIFNDTWRRHRDFFYDPNMHGVDWEGLREQYGALIEDARTRWDVSNIQSNLAAELSAGHTYTRGGDVEGVQNVSTGFLGIDWMPSGDLYRIGKIVRPAAWDTEVRSPFDLPGVDIEQGDYIHSVNGIAIKTDKDPYAAFEGLAGKTVSLKVSKDGNANNVKSYIIECLTDGQESQLRSLAWIEGNRKMVDELSDGKLGYVYMSNTSGRGQLELVRMYYGQLDKEGFIIDERFNGGGQLADRFLELMTKPVVYNLHWRHGRDHTWPIKTNRGPKGMLINGWAGSGGDGLPWAFQELKAGPIVGERTVGILVGPATGHQLIDGGGITVPGARLYDNDGHWFWEGEGVAPDIKVWDDPNILMKGRDPQIEKVVEEVVKMIPSSPKDTPAPAPEDRTAEGLRK